MGAGGDMRSFSEPNTIRPASWGVLTRLTHLWAHRAPWLVMPVSGFLFENSVQRESG